MSTCNPTPSGNDCLVDPTKTASSCSPWQLTNQTRIDCLTDNYQQESLNIAGVDINVFKLLGVHEQTSLIDLIKNGNPISGGDHPQFPAKYAFDITTSKWKSYHSGPNVTISSYIGYDFGEVKLPNGRIRYGIQANVRNHITTIRIKQGKNPENRAVKARVERSEDGSRWYGVAIVNLPDNDDLNTIHFKHSVASRYWRLRPIEFKGGDCDSWIVQSLEMHDFSSTDKYNIQDKILMENRDRDYANEPIKLKGFYDAQSTVSDLTRFMIELSNTITYQIKVNFNACVSILGRPVIIGDIIELPNEVQYTPDLQPIKRYLEVTDVSWDTSSYSPTWQPTMLMITAAPAVASVETQDVFGKLSKSLDESGLYDNDTGENLVWQDYSDITQAIQAESKDQLPEKGSDEVNVIRYFELEEIEQAKAVGITTLEKLSYKPNTLYTEGAIPPNGQEYTEGPTFPESPNNGDYHRLTYEGLSKDVPARLHRWSSAKNRWIFLEADRRSLYNGQKPILNEYLKSPNKISSKDVK